MGINPKLKKTIFVLHLSAILLVLLGFLFFILDPSSYKTFVFILVLSISIGFAIFLEIVVSGLKNTKYWAWVAGVIICAVYVLRLLFGLEIENLFGGILGIIGLFGLLNKEVIKSFTKKKR